ncbi:cytochrome P450 2J4-like [Lytechinus variegatus]|uniref:cytochrome P450 2J4-like n=1 Tax=Lytechinus variegatus TaxID=7654 RepID=UPI001BB2CC0B|nr:cytochrome P450 2J4-like [Lytechinus variegatus]
MEPIILFLMTATVGLLTVWIIKQLLIGRPKNLPPGPSWIQIVGIAWTACRAGLNPLTVLSSWAKKYGEIVSFYVGTKPFVILNSYPIIVEAFRHPDLQGRPQSRMREEVVGPDCKGVVFASGLVWKEQRKFVHSVFRSLGVGKKSYEDTVLAEMTQLCTNIEEKRGSPFGPSIFFMQAISNIICSVVLGTQYKYDDADFQQILQILNDNIRQSGAGGTLFFLPLPGISKIPFGKVKTMVDNFKTFQAFITSQIESHEANFDPCNPRDFVDQYLIKMSEIEDTNSPFTKMNLNSCIADLFIAGSETTATTLSWCILFMMAYPEVQSRVQEELDHVIGRERLPRLNDQGNLPYTCAVLMEIQRKGVIAPLGVPHLASADTAIGGYTIPKGATVVSNIFEVLNNEDLWRNPDAFEPRRFLNQKGEVVKRDELIFFSTGRRVCLGEQLARMETFLGFTSLLQRFTFKKPDSSPALSFDGVVGVTRNPQPYLTSATPRY